jgi:hypothetical protein
MAPHRARVCDSRLLLQNLANVMPAKATMLELRTAEKLTLRLVPKKAGPIGPTQRFNGTVVLTSRRSRAILGPLDILVDIGVLAEKEVIQ